MTFKEERFPEEISYGSTGGPEFSSIVTTLNNGYEHHQTNCLFARMKYTIYYNTKSDEQLLELLSFFYDCRGTLIPFRFKDWLDYKTTNQIIGTGDGKNKNFQLIKTYGKNNIYRRIIKKPVENTVNIYLNNHLNNDGLLIDYKSGEIEFLSPPEKNKIITADFEFDVPVRFNTNSLIYSTNGFKQNNCSIQLIEIKT